MNLKFLVYLTFTDVFTLKKQELSEELEQLKTEKCNLEDKNKSLHGQTGGKTKQIKDLNQEIKTLKGKLTTMTKQKTSKEEGVRLTLTNLF